MDLDVVFLGTGGSIPSARRSTAAVLVRRGGDRLLIDCGEGTQRQMQRSTGLVQLDEVLITHLHADHYLGLPGLVKTYDMQDRDLPLVIHGPRGLAALWRTLTGVVGRTGYEIVIEELDPSVVLERSGYSIGTFAIEHRIAGLGYALFEPPRPGRFDPERARELGVEPGPDFGALQDGREVAGRDGAVRPEQVLGEERPGRKLVVTGDTAPCEATRVAAHGADLLVHDASFTTAEAERAWETGHSTARQAAEIASDAAVGMLALVHISARHFIPDVLEEAREGFEPTIAPRDFDVVELPFAERGEPTLVENGARQRPEPEPEPGPGGAASASSAS